jgi:hypothetical protein
MCCLVTRVVHAACTRQVVVSNLVDSNVFLRAVILSLEFFSARRVELEVACPLMPSHTNLLVTLVGRDVVAMHVRPSSGLLKCISTYIHVCVCVRV